MDSTVDQQELLKRLEDPIWRMNNLYAIRTKMQGFEGETIIYEPNYVQKKIYQKIEEGWKRIIILKPRKLGVTTGVSLYLLDKAMFGRNQMCRTIAHRKQTVTELFNDIPRFAFEELKRRSPTFAPKEKYTTRSELEFVGTGSKYSIDVEARGMTPTFLHFSEIAYIDDEAKLIDSLESLSRNNVGIAESTANGKGNWFHRTFMNNYELLQRGETPEWYPLFFPWFSDPDNWLPWHEGSKLFYPEECLEQKRKYRNPDGTDLRKEQILWWDRKKFELGDLLPEKYPSEPEEAFLHQTGRVYPEFSTMHNVIKQVQFKEYKIAMDYGQKNPMVFACIHQDFDSNFTVFREFYKTNCPIRDAAQWLRQYCPEKVDEDGYVFIDFPDPSVFNDTQQNPYEYKPGQHRYSIADEFMRHKVILRPGVQNDILAGLVRVGEYLKFDPMHPNPYKRDQNGNPRLGSPRFFITENCKNIIGEFELYRWPKEKSGALDKNAYEKPVKENDHGMDAIRYALLSDARPLEYDVQSDEVFVPDSVRSAVERVQQHRRDQEQSHHLRARAL